MSTYIFNLVFNNASMINQRLPTNHTSQANEVAKFLLNFVRLYRLTSNVVLESHRQGI